MTSANSRERLEELDREIAAAKTAMWDANAEWQKFPKAMSPSGLIDRADFVPGVLIGKVKAGIVVNDAKAAVMRLELQRAQVELALVSDAKAIAALERDAANARKSLDEAEESARVARAAFTAAKNALAARSERRRELQTALQDATWEIEQAEEATRRESAELAHLEALAARQVATAGVLAR